MQNYDFRVNLIGKVTGIIQISLVDITKQILSKLMTIKAAVSKLNLVFIKILITNLRSSCRNRSFSYCQTCCTRSILITFFARHYFFFRIIKKFCSICIQVSKSGIAGAAIASATLVDFGVINKDNMQLVIGK